jgi:uncharacterized protein YndB with AHSA1/START domain
MNATQGVVRQVEDRGEVRFIRRYTLTPAELWPYLTRAEHLSVWITAGAEFDARVGGRVCFPWQRGPAMEGVVIVCDEPRVLEYTWAEGGTESRVRIVLTDDRDGTLLVIEHAGLPLQESTGFAAGWHTHLDWLEHAIDGRGSEFDEPTRFQELAEQYGYAPNATSDA